MFGPCVSFTPKWRPKFLRIMMKKMGIALYSEAINVIKGKYPPEGFFKQERV